MWIAPSRHPEIGNWTDTHWEKLSFASQQDWGTAFEIFEDRIRYRFLDAIDVMQKDDNDHYFNTCQRRFGFAMMALDCLLIETLAQFYGGWEDSIAAQKALKIDNKCFYTKFLTKKSFVLTSVFDQNTADAFYRTIRCGILHQAETKEDSTIRYYDDIDNSDEPFTLLDDGKSLRIHWSNFHPLVLQEFEAYCARLRNDEESDLRDKFKRKMDFICRIGEAA